MTRDLQLRHRTRELPGCASVAIVIRALVRRPVLPAGLAFPANSKTGTLSAPLLPGRKVKLRHLVGSEEEGRLITANSGDS